MNELIMGKWWTQIFTNPLYLAMLMAFFLLIGYIAGKNKWIKRGNALISIFIYLFTFLGIVGMTYDNRNYIINIDQNTIQQRIEIDYQREFLNQLDCLESYLSYPLVRNDHSPTNFDQLQKERNDFHEWIVSNKEYIEFKVNNFEFLHEDSLYYPMFKDSINIQELNHIKMNVKDFNKNLSIYLNIQRCAYKNAFEITISLLYPLLFIIGLALQIVKECFLSMPKD